jgi:predicted secreted hydrolase
MRAGVAIAMTVVVLAAAASATAQSGLQLPVPERPTADDLLSWQNASGDGQGPLPGAGACNSAAEQPLSFPRDDGPHEDAYFEWWFWNGHLRSSNGRRYAFIVYFLARPWLGAYGVDYSLLDLQDHRFHYGREALVAPPSSSNGQLRLVGVHASVRGSGGHDVVRLEIDGAVLHLDMRASKPPMPMFGDGSDTFYCNSSHYYARSRMATTGTVRLGDTKQHVQGLGWFDHQWGFLPALFAARWQYLQLQLDDGRDIFLGKLAFPPGREDFTMYVGAISRPDGSVRALHRGDFTIRQTGVWRRDATCSYPVDLEVTVGAEHFRIRPALRNTELRATGPELAVWPENPVYWDGETVVSGDAVGRGWLDLAKYCAA